jgi:hypothetical protein
MESNGVHRELERKANELRANLDRHLDELHERRERLVDTARSFTRPPLSLLLGAAAALAVGVVVLQQVRARRRPVSLRALLGAGHLQREKGLLRRGLEKGGLSLVALAVQRLGQRGLDRWLPEAPEPEPLELGAMSGSHDGAGEQEYR